MNNNVNRLVKEYIGDVNGTGMLSYVSSMVFDLFGEKHAPSKVGKSQNLTVLLFLYLAVRVNRHFSIMLTSVCVFDSSVLY